MYLAAGHFRPQLDDRLPSRAVGLAAACPGNSGKERGGAVNRPPPFVRLLQWWERMPVTPCRPKCIVRQRLGPESSLVSPWRMTSWRLWKGSGPQSSVWGREAVHFQQCVQWTWCTADLDQGCCGLVEGILLRPPRSRLHDFGWVSRARGPGDGLSCLQGWSCRGGLKTFS